MFTKERGSSVLVDPNHASASAKRRLPRPLDAVAYFWKSLTAPSSTASIRRFSGWNRAPDTVEELSGKDRIRRPPVFCVLHHGPSSPCDPLEQCTCRGCEPAVPLECDRRIRIGCSQLSESAAMRLSMPQSTGAEDIEMAESHEALAMRRTSAGAVGNEAWPR